MLKQLEVASATTDECWAYDEPKAGGQLLCLPEGQSSANTIFNFWKLNDKNQVAFGIKNPLVHQSYFLIGNDGANMEILRSIIDPDACKILFEYGNCIFNYVEDKETFYFRLQHAATGSFVQKALNQDGVLLLVDDPKDASFWYLNVKLD